MLKTYACQKKYMSEIYAYQKYMHVFSEIYDD